jgi:hypothetical protein
MKKCTVSTTLSGAVPNAEKTCTEAALPNGGEGAWTETPLSLVFAAGRRGGTNGRIEARKKGCTRLISYLCRSFCCDS